MYLVVSRYSKCVDVNALWYDTVIMHSFPDSLDEMKLHIEKSRCRYYRLIPS